MEFDAIYQGLITGEEKLALVGLGYVGMPLCGGVCQARSGHWL